MLVLGKTILPFGADTYSIGWVRDGSVHTYVIVSEAVARQLLHDLDRHLFREARTTVEARHLDRIAELKRSNAALRGTVARLRKKGER